MYCSLGSLVKAARSTRVTAVSLVVAVVLAGTFGHALATVAGAKDLTPVERGHYLVSAMGCNDCHTPWKMGANGPEPDMSRMLSGHPESIVVTSQPALAMPWGAATSATFTAWAGPWGVSFTPNLTPDPETGMGKWKEEEFVSAMKSGRHMGRGRPILPPMPFQNLAGLNDQDLSAIFAYLHTIPAVKNRVPEPLSPPAPPAK